MDSDEPTYEWLHKHYEQHEIEMEAQRRSQDDKFKEMRDSINRLQSELDERKEEIARLGRLQAAEESLHLAHERLMREENERLNKSLDEQRKKYDSLKAHADRLATALDGVLDRQSCRLDHHGNCQEHMLENPCCNRIGLEVLSSYRKEMGE